MTIHIGEKCEKCGRGTETIYHMDEVIMDTNTNLEYRNKHVLCRTCLEERYPFELFDWNENGNILTIDSVGSLDKLKKWSEEAKNE